MPINGKVKYIYDTLKGGGGDVGTEEEFNDWFFAKGEQGYKNRMSVYKTLTDGGADAGANYEEFRDWLGLKAVQPSKPVTQQPTQQVQQQPKPQPQPQQQPQQKGTPMTEAERVAMQMQTGDTMRRARQSQDSFSRRMENIRKGNTIGQTSQQKFNPVTGQLERKYYTTAGNEVESSLEQSRENLAERDRWEATTEEGRKHRSQRMKNDFYERVGAAVNKYDTDNAAETVWQRAEDKAKEEFGRYLDERNKPSWNNFIRGAADGMNVTGGFGADNVDTGIQAFTTHLKYHDIKRMADDAWNMLGKDKQQSIINDIHGALKSIFPKATDAELQQTARDMAREQSDRRMFELAVEKNAPSSATEYFFRKAIGMNSLVKLYEALGRSSAGTTGDWEARQLAEQEYDKKHKIAGLAGTVTGFVFDPLVMLSAGVGSAAVKGAQTLAGKIIGEAAVRKGAQTLAGRLAAGAVGGATNFGTFEAGSEALEQLRWGGHRNEETGEIEGYSPEAVGKQFAHGFVMGTATGSVAPLLGNVSDKLVRATDSTVGKMGIRAAELGVGTIAEGTIFSVPEWIEGSRDAMDVWTDNMAMMAGFKVQHLVKSAPRVIGELAASRRGKAGFETRLRSILDGRGDLALTADEKEELKSKGYGDLKDLTDEYGRYIKAKEEYDKARPSSTDGRRLMIEGEVRDLPYNRFVELMNDGTVSEAARAKMYYYLTGHILPMSTVIGSNTIETKDPDGRVTGYTVQSFGANGVITSRTFGSRERADVEANRINRQAELNSIDVGERYFDAKTDKKRMEQACKNVAKKINGEDWRFAGGNAFLYKRLYNLMNMKLEEMNDVEKEWADDIREEYNRLGDTFEYERYTHEGNGNIIGVETETINSGSKGIRTAINEEFGVDVDKAIRKERNRRSQQEQKAVEEYASRLYADVRRKQEEAAGREEQPANPDAPTSDSRITALLGIDDEEQPDDTPVNESFSRGHDADIQERKDIAIELANGNTDAQSAWDGVVQRINEDAAYMAAQERERAKQIQNKDDGTFRTATLRETDEDGNGKQVYIIAGNVAMTSDGTAVDTSVSDRTISIFDPSTGEPRMIDPSEIAALGSVTSAEQYDADIEQKRQDYIKQQIDEAQGTIQIVPGGSVTLPTGEEALVLGTMDADGEDVLVQVGDQRDVVKRTDIQQAADDRAIEDYRQRHGIQEDESMPEEGMQNGAPSEYVNGMEIVIREQDGDYGTFSEKTGLVLRRVRAEMRGGKIEYVPDAEGNLIEYLVGDEVRHDHIADLNNMIVRHSSDVQEGETESGSPASLAGIRRERTQDGQQQDEYEPAEEYETPIGGEVSEDEYEPAELPEYGYDEGNYERVMPMVGEGEDAEPDFLATTPQRGHRYLYEEARLPRKVADNIVSANLSAADKELKKQQKAIDTLDGNPGTSIAQYQKKRRDLEEKLTGAQATHDYWQAVKTEQDKVVAAEAAERARQESALHEQAAEDERRRQEQELAKRREQEERGANTVSPSIREKWDNAPKVEGAENEITLANGEIVKGRYMLVESGAATPSHNPNAEFTRNEGFPVDENGQTVNDRDYERDKDAQNITRQMAAQYDSRAIQSVPVVSRDGIVLSGNGRTMAGELAAQNNTDGAYIGHLQKYPQQFGFTTEQVQAMNHPRVVFVPDEDMPYTTDTFAKFNQQDMKSQSRTEQSVKLGKTVDDSIFNRIIQSINTFDSISDFYNDAQASTNAIAELRNAGVINAMQYAEMFDGEKISMTGRQMLENMLVGKAFESNPDAIRQLAEYPSMRQSVISALAEISNNVALGEDYSLEKELAEAINLAYQARKSGYKAGDVVSSYARQLNLFPFDEGSETVADYTNAAVLMLADVLNDSRTGMLKKTLALYNREAADSAAGQIDMFSGGVKTKQEILKEVLNILNYGTENQQRTALAAAAEQRKSDAAAGQGGGGEGVQPNGTTGESGTEGTDAAIRTAEAETDTNPTDAQKEAGNYKKGHVRIDGFDVTIENPKGSTRSGKDASGKAWSVTMNNTYGYIRGTEGVDGDHIDVFLSDNMDGWNGTVYVVDQIKADGTFDEHKVMYGFNSAEEAAEAYNSNYSEGWQGLGTITGVSKDEFTKWIDSSHRKTKPFAEYKSVKTEEGQSEQQPVNVEEEPTATSGNGYTITPATYTTKKGKELAMQLVTFDNDLTKEQKRAADKLAREKKGWFDRSKNGYMMRSEADAEELAKMLGNDAAVQEAQPVSLADIRDVTDEAESRPQEQTKTAAGQPQETPQPEQKEESKPKVTLGFGTQATGAKDKINAIRIFQQELTNIINKKRGYADQFKKFDEYRKKYGWKKFSDFDLYAVFDNNGNFIGIADSPRGAYDIALNNDFESFMVVRQQPTDEGIEYNATYGWLFTNEIPESQWRDDKGVLREEVRQKATFSIARNLPDVKTTEATEQPKADESEPGQKTASSQQQEEQKEPKSKYVSDEDAERFEQLKKRLKQKLRGQMNMGIDPEIFTLGVEMTYMIVKNQARKFAEYARAMIEEMGDAIRPYLKTFYNGARDLPELEDIAGELTPYEEVRAFDVANFDKEGAKDLIKTAEVVSKEDEANRQAEQAKEKITKSRNERLDREMEVKRTAAHFPMETPEEAAAFDRRIPDMSDEELLAYMKEDGNGDVNKAFHTNLYDEYDYRHNQEEADAYDRYLQQLRESDTTSEQAEEMLGNLHRDKSQFVTEDRPLLLGQEEALQDYMSELRNESRSEETDNNSQADTDVLSLPQPIKDNPNYSKEEQESLMYRKGESMEEYGERNNKYPNNWEALYLTQKYSDRMDDIANILSSLSAENADEVGKAIADIVESRSEGYELLSLLRNIPVDTVLPYQDAVSAAFEAKESKDSGKSQPEKPTLQLTSEQEGKPKTRKRTTANQKDKIDDVGEHLWGARKDIRREIARNLANITEKALIEKPFGKVYKKPDLKKAVESGALREKDAIFYEAFFSLINQQKPKATQSDARMKRYSPSYRTKTEEWATATFKALDTLRLFMEAEEAERDAVIEATTKDHYPNREQELAEIERRKGWNLDGDVKHEWGDKTTPNPLWITYEVMKRLGYNVGDKLDIPYGIIKANFSGTGYSIENLKGEGNQYKFGNKMSLDEAIDMIVYLARLKRGDSDISHPTQFFYFAPTKSEYGDSGRYRVMYGGGRLSNIKFSEFNSKEEADTFAAKKKSAVVSPIKEVVRRYGYKIGFSNPLTGDRFYVDEAEFDTKEEAMAHLDGNFDKINDTTNTKIDEERAKKGERKQLTADDVVHVSMVHSAKNGWKYAVLIDAKYANNLGQPYIIREGFEDRKDAIEFANGIKDEVLQTVLKHKEEGKKIVYFDTGKDSRFGEDYRNGKDVTAEDFMNTFGFRGVQFGNWANQADRQMAVNQAYDAFMDMAKLIGVSPKAMSLNGELGIAFGARGVGGFAAHYEGGDSVVINLTKTQGAGSLAHEWWHALDNYFSRKQGDKNDMVTDNRRIAMREELRKAFDNMLDMVSASDYAARSRSKGEYWGRMHEITARLLAEWVDRELKKRGELNTFLSRGANIERMQRHNYDRYVSIEKLAGREPVSFEDYKEKPESLRGIPYPSDKEIEQFGDAMRNIFDTIQEREDENGNIVLYEPSATYGTRDGSTIVWRSLFDEYEMRGEVNPETTSDKKGKSDKDFNPTELHLRKLKKGETCHVERVYEETKQFDFTGKDKVESSEDVAYIFKQLENAAVENSFLVLVKDGKPTVIHLGMGSYSQTMAPYEKALVAYQSLKPDKVYFIHNHPSGALIASKQDKDLLKRVKQAFGEDVVQQGIIIDTKSGKYGEYDLTSDKYDLIETSNVLPMPQSESNEVPIKVYQFSRQVFAPDWNPETAENAGSPDSIAKFVSSHRLGEHKKMSFLVLNNQYNVVANVFLPWTRLSDIKQSNKAGDLLAKYVHQCGGTCGILYGNYEFDINDRGIVGAVGKRMKVLGTRLIDVLHVEHSAYYSGWEGVGEPGSNYDTSDVSSEPVLFRDSSTPIFYSNAARAVEQVRQEKATPEQWLKMIEKNGGLKSGEDKWIGLSDWLKESKAKSLTKQEVMDYILSNQIQIEETGYADKQDYDISKDEVMNSDAFQGLLEELTEYDENDNPYISQEKFNKMRHDDNNFFNGFSIDYWGETIEVDDPQSAALYLGLIGDNISNEINDTRLSYTTQGLENKREIALTVPTIESWNTQDEIHFGDAGQGRAVAWVRFGDTTIEAPAEGLDKSKYTAKPNKQGGFDVYRPNGSEWGRIGAATAEQAIDEAYQDDVLRNKTTQRVLVIDEIQSKRHQEGREKGYKPPMQNWYKDRDELERYRNKLYQKYGVDRLTDLAGKLTPEESTRYDELVSRYNESSPNKGGVPSAPFEKNWHELAMKRMLRYAAENGYDKVAWTTGEQQAERYNIGNVVHSIHWGKKGDNKWVRIYSNNNHLDLTFIIDEKGTILENKQEFSSYGSEFVGKPLSDVVGKEVAQKILNDEGEKREVNLASIHSVHYSLEGDGLRIGGEGMKGFYDKMLPSFMNKYGKKWGVKVGTVELPNVEESARTMWSIDVTPEMVQSVMEGQPMFRTSGQLNEEFGDRWLTEQTNDDGRHSTQVANTISSYKTFGEWVKKVSGGRKVSVLDASSGLGIGTQWMRENGMDVDDVEPYPSSNRIAPTYDSYNAINRKYDYIISNAVLNVIPDDWRTELLHDMADKLNVGGKLVINVRNAKSIATQGKEGRSKITLDEPSEILVTRPNGSIRAYQKGFTKAELKEWCEKELGDAYTVESATNKNAGGTYDTAVVVTKNRETESKTDKMRSVASQLGDRLNTPLNIIEDVNEITHPNKKIQERQRRSKGWYDPVTGQVYVVLPNNRDVDDVKATIGHETVAHKGLRELVGEERYNEFLDETYRHLRDDLKKDVDDAAGREFLNGLNNSKQRKTRSYEECRRIAVDELFGRMAEKPFEEFSEGERTLWQRIKDAVRKILDRFLGSLKLPDWFELGDNELRYILWRSKERLERGKESPIDLARDIVKREELGLGELARENTELSDIESKAKADGTWMKAPNGKPTNLNERQWLQVRTKSFKQWFGDWEKDEQPSSKIASDNGEPMVFYHGTNRDFSEFDPEKSAGMMMFTSDENLARKFAAQRYKFDREGNLVKDKNGEPVKGDVIMPVYLNVRNPKVIDMDGYDWYGRGVGENAGKDINKGRKHNFSYLEAKQAQREGHDGLILKNVSDSGVKSDHVIVFEANQIKSATNNIGTYRRDSNDIRFRDPDETEDIWNDQSLSLQESITAAKTRLASRHRDNRTLRNDAMRAIGGNLSDLRRAMSLQRTFDMTTVKRVSDLARILMDSGYLNDLTQQEVKRLLAAVKNSVGREDIESSVQKVMDIMVDNQLKQGENTLHELEAIKGSKVDARGVEVQGQLDPAGAHIMKVFKKTRGWDKTDVEEAIADAQQRMGSSDAAVADEAALEYTGLQLAMEYAENIKDSKVEERKLREEIKQAHDTTSERDRATDSYRQYIASLQEAIRQNKIERAQGYFDLVGRLSDSLRGSIANAKEFKESEKRRIREIQHNANSDMEGRPSDEHYKPKFMDKFVNNSFVSYVFAPLSTFEQMLRMFGGKSANGEGYLFNRFMRGWVDARQKEIRGVRDKYSVLDAKAAELFGGKVRTWGDLIRRVGKLPKGTVSFWNGGEMKECEMTQGNLMYIYMVNKMLDGRMKLRKMGITDEKVADIKEVLDPRLIELADWLQDEFLVGTRNEYNETHKRMFGASMAAIEHYFPLKILANARADKPEDLDNPDKGDGISTATGSIIKRRRNTLALDITGADALSVILDHVAQMEHWNAFAEFNRDLNTLRTYKRFRNQVQNMTTIYGSGRELWRKFNDVCQMAAGTYRPPRAKLDEAAVNFAKGVTAAKVSFRIFTALKQLLSMPAYIPDARADYLARNIANPVGAWKWSMEHLPIFNERWRSRMVGDPRLMKSDMDWKQWRSRIVQLASRVGMSPNAFVDALTVSIGAHSIYQTRLAQYLRDGYGQEDAEKKAVQDAEMLYNLTQQSSEGAFTSTMQVDRSWLSVLFTVFRNASMSYQRQLHDALRNFKHNLTPGGRTRSIEFMKKQLLREWNSPVDADGNWSEEDSARAEQTARRKFKRQLRKDILRVGTFGYIMQLAWNLGAYLPYMLFGGDDDEKQKMWYDVFAHTAFGSVEGLTGGDLMSQAGQMWRTGDGNPAYLSKDMPLTSDITEAFKKFGNGRKEEALNDIINIIVQSGIGVNPQSITDAVLAVMDACGNDVELANEATICISRILQIPQSQIEKMYLDEVGLDGKDVKNYTFSQLAERYARYRVRRSRLFAPWSWDDEERIDKEKERLSGKYKERLELKGDDALRDIFDSNSGDMELRKMAGSEIAKHLGGRDSYGSPKSEYGQIYLQERSYVDIAEDVLLQTAESQAKENGDTEREKAIKRARANITDIKKALAETPYTDAEGNKVTAEDVMGRLRKTRRELMDELGIENQ